MPYYRALCVGLVAFILAVIALTGPDLAQSIRVGLEFRGGYEILYVVSPTAERPLDHASLVKTAQILSERANRLGVSEPDVVIEGQNQIRLRLAGISEASQLRQALADPAGLPTHLTEKYSQTVGAVLGAEDLQATLEAGLIALALIFAFLLFVYRAKGVIAVVCLASYLWLLLLAFNLLDATLSMAAIVAFVLGVGIASDANILSFERIREELRRGSKPSVARREGESRSLRTILDANAAGFICAAVLFAAGVGPIRGFALTMMLSIALSVIANVFLARLLVALWFSRRGEDQGWRRTIRPLHAKTSGPDLVGARRRFFVVSGLLAAAGAVALWALPLNYDIDFKAGTALDITLPRAIDQAKATDILTQGGIPPATVAIAGASGNQVAARFDDVLSVDQIGREVDAFKSDYGSTVAFEENTADPSVARQLAVEAIGAIAAALIGVFVFLVWRFDWRVAVAALVGVVNSVFFVLTVFAIGGLEIDVTFIAAILTIIGFAVNEAVVVFDRIRENRHQPDSGVPSSAAGLVNASIRQIVRRSLFTALTVITGSVCLFLFGAEPLQMFSLAIFLGLICGTYSSLCIAPQVCFLLARHQTQPALA